MRLAALMAEIDHASGPVLGIDLAHRLGIPPAELEAMLAALRASGRLVIEGPRDPAGAACPSAGACSMSCPGSEDCSLMIDLNVTGLEISTPLLMP